MKTAGLLIVVALTSVSFAQDLTNLPAYKTAPGVVAAERKAEMLKTVLELPQPADGPVAELDVNEFQMKQADYVGQVVKLTFDEVLTLKQEGRSGYIATVTYKREQRDGSRSSSVEIAIPPEGLKLFQEVYDLNGSTRQTTVMVQVLVESKTRAVGARYRRDNPEGQKYVW
jgi:hypothetical protein